MIEVPFRRMRTLLECLVGPVKDWDVMCISDTVTPIGLLVSRLPANRWVYVYLVDIFTLSLIGDYWFEEDRHGDVFFGDMDWDEDHVGGVIYVEIPSCYIKGEAQYTPLYLDGYPFMLVTEAMESSFNPGYWDYIRELISKVGLYSRFSSIYVKSHAEEVNSNVPFMEMVSRAKVALATCIYELLGNYPFDLIKEVNQDD